jgi:hypothetical protein
LAEPNRWTIWEAAPKADEEACAKHFTAFVNSFVQKSRRERWLHYLLKRPNQPKKWRNLFNELENQLESERYSIVEHSQVEELRQSSIAIAKRVGEDKGLYYGFCDEPKLLSVEDAFIMGSMDDAIFSIVPGKIAIVFNSDGFVYLCKT